MKRVMVGIFLFISLLLLSGAPVEKASAADPIEIIGVNYPTEVAPGEAFSFSVTVKVNQGQLLESRGDMLRNVDGNLYGHWPHIAVEGTVNTGGTYTFNSYGNMTAPTALGTYTSTWQIWRDGHWDGPQVTMTFTVSPTGGGGSNRGWWWGRPTEVRKPCTPSFVRSGIDVDSTGEAHNYIDLTIRESSLIKVEHGTPPTGWGPKSKDWRLNLLIKWREITGLGPVLQWLGPGSDTFADGTNPREKVPADTYRVYLWGRIFTEGTQIISVDLEPWNPFNSPTTINVALIRDKWLNDPGSLVYFDCVYQGKTTSASTLQYPLYQSYLIPQPQAGTRYTYPVTVFDWLNTGTLTATLRKSSNATLSFIAPDGTVYTNGSPNVEYIDTPGYATITVKNVTEGDWTFAVDTTEASIYSIFVFSIIGTPNAEAEGDLIGPFTTIEISGTPGENGWYISDVVVTPTAEDNPGGSGIARTEYSIDGGLTWITVNGPFTISQEGSTNLIVRSWDAAGNEELIPAEMMLYIDKTPPTVNVWTDFVQYTRVDPFVVHYETYDPMPGSGICAQSADLDGTAVENEQTIDMLLFHVTSHTITAQGTDCAGWETTNSATWELIATLESMRIAMVDRFCTEGYITDRGLCNSLTQKLDAAIAARDRNRLNTAINILGAFRAEVTAQTGKKIPANIAELLHEDAIYVIDQLQAP